MIAQLWIIDIKLLRILTKILDYVFFFCLS